MPRVDVTKNYVRKRQFSPKKCAPGSFRTKTISATTKLVVCCPRGKWSRGRCKVGTRAQSILKRR
jgi:hypothetical protein